MSRAADTDSRTQPPPFITWTADGSRWWLNPCEIVRVQLQPDGDVRVWTTDRRSFTIDAADLPEARAWVEQHMR